MTLLDCTVKNVVNHINDKMTERFLKSFIYNFCVPIKDYEHNPGLMRDVHRAVSREHAIVYSLLITNHEFKKRHACCKVIALTTRGTN